MEPNIFTGNVYSATLTLVPALPMAYQINLFNLFTEVTNGEASVMTIMVHEDWHFIHIVISGIQF